MMEDTDNQYSVRIWYISGAFERITDCPTMGWAVLYYKQALQDERVAAVEIHNPDGKKHVGWTRPGT